jgi:hypothetical protein
MADWISEVNEREQALIAAGVPAPEAQRVATLFANALAQADKARRVAAQERDAADNLHRGADVLARRQRCHRSTVYRRARRGRLSHVEADNATKP